MISKREENFRKFSDFVLVFKKRCVFGKQSNRTLMTVDKSRKTRKREQ